MGGTPISHPKMIMLLGKPMGLLGKPTILGKHPYSRGWENQPQSFRAKNIPIRIPVIKGGMSLSIKS